MTPIRSASTLTSMAYSERTRLGFRILLWLHQEGRIDEQGIPDDVIKMIRVWSNMKKGRKHHFKDTIASKLMSLLDEVPTCESEAFCPDNVVKHIEAEGEQLLIDGYIVIYPTADGWSYRRTQIGEHMLRVRDYR